MMRAGHTWSMCASSMLPFFSNTTSKSVSGSCREGRGSKAQVDHGLHWSSPAGEIVRVGKRRKTAAPPLPSRRLPHNTCLPLSSTGAKSKRTLCDPMACRPPGSSQARILECHYCHFLLQGIFLTQGIQPIFLCLLHWQADSLPLNLPCNIGDMGSIPGQGTKIPHAAEKLNLHRAHAPQQESLCPATGDPA